jgi:hypothetical protein
MPKSYGEVLLDESGILSFAVEGTELQFLLAGPESIAAPVEISPHYASNLRSVDRSADYVIIAASHLVGDAEALARVREADGYRVLLVDVDDVFWEFADGEPDPLAIRDFLSYATREWHTGPRFAALVGKGTLDYRDIMGLGGNWLPAALAPTEGGLFPSDSMLGDLDGDDGVPEIAIGRLPVTTGEELERIVDRIVSFEAGHETMRVMFAADDSERDEFAAASRALMRWAPSDRTDEIDLNVESFEDARDRLFASWQAPLGWLSFVGHGGLDRLSTEGLLRSEDILELAQSNGAPVVLAWSCNIARFDIPGFFSLGEQLLTEGTSAGVFSATGWSNHVDTDALRTAFTEAVFASDVLTIGEAMLHAHRSASEAPKALHRVYMLLGDPALRLRAAKATPEPQPEPGPGPGPGVDDGESDPGAQPRIDDYTASGTGCEIAASRTVGGPLGLGSLIFGALLLNRRRRR